MGKEFKNISETKKEATKKRKVDEQNQVKKEIKKQNKSQEKIKNTTNQKAKPGRPKKNNQQQQQTTMNIQEIAISNEKKKVEFIVDHKFCIKLMKIFTFAGSIQTKQRIGQQIERKMYLILPHHKEKLSFDQNGDLQDHTQYKLITLEPKQNEVDFIKKVNLVCKQLDDDFIPELQLIIERYLNESQNQKNQFEQFLVVNQEEFAQQTFDSQEFFTNAQSSEFEYLKKWNKDKSLTYKQQLQEERQVLTQKLENHGYKKENDKPFQNYKQKITKQLDKIDKQMQFTPIECLIRQLIKAFNQELNIQTPRESFIQQLINEFNQEFKNNEIEVQDIDYESNQFPTNKYCFEENLKGENPFSNQFQHYYDCD